MIRLFVAIEIPEPIRDTLPLPDDQIEGCDWVPDENLHLTLRFVGEVDNGQARDIDDVLSGIRGQRFALTLAGLDTFGGRNPHALYASVRPNPALTTLQHKVDMAVSRLGLLRENRKFTPHVTLARLRHPAESKLAAFIQRNNLFASDPFDVTEFCLYSSVLHPGGSAYTIERTYPLN